MDSLNSLVKNELFRATELYEEFKNRPLGFVDVGARGGVHPFILPIASLVNCLCFEPNEGDEKILYFNKPSDFSNLIIYTTALSNKTLKRVKFYITQLEQNSSLFKPNKKFIERYGMNEYFLKEITEVNTQTLDSAVKEVEQLYPNVAEIIKLDTQGAEYLILQGGKKVLKSQCMILVCEVHFRHIYKNIKLFSEIDQFLSKEGFVLFDLVPLVTFAHQMDGRGILGPQERFMAADAYYILDPLEQRTKNLRFSERSIKVLILGAILLKYFRFAYQLIQKFIKNNTEKTRLINLVECLSMDQAMDQKCNAFIQQARFYLQGQRYKEAEEKLKEALSLNPTFNTLTSINYALASLYERKGDLKRAKEKFREVIESARGVPSFVGGAHFHLGCIHKRMGNIKKAKHHFEECLKFIPDHGEAWKALRSIYPPRKQS